MSPPGHPGHAPSEAARGLLIFDIDGTLFHTDTVTVPAVQQTLAEYGLPAAAEADITDFFGKPSSDFYAWLRSLCPPGIAVDEVVAAVERRELANISQTGRLYPAMREVLTTLRARSRQMAICSNGRHVYVERVLAAHDLGGYFDAVRHRVSERDTKPGMVGELLARLHSRPAIVIGDRHDDVEAAHQNGLAVIAASYGYGRNGELTGADAVAAAPLELPDLVQSLLSR